MTMPTPRRHGSQHESRPTVRDFELGLASVLQRLVAEPLSWLVIAEMERRPPLRYLQFLADEDGTLVAECVSNRFLDEGERWRPDQERLLLELGWSMPQAERPNWHVIGRSDEAIEQIREIVHLTLTELFGAEGDEEIDLNMSWSTQASDN